MRTNTYGSAYSGAMKVRNVPFTIVACGTGTYVSGERKTAVRSPLPFGTLQPQSLDALHRRKQQDARNMIRSERPDPRAVTAPRMRTRCSRLSSRLSCWIVAAAATPLAADAWVGVPAVPRRSGGRNGHGFRQQNRCGVQQRSDVGASRQLSGRDERRDICCWSQATADEASTGALIWISSIVPTHDAIVVAPLLKIFTRELRL